MKLRILILLFLPLAPIFAKDTPAHTPIIKVVDVKENKGTNLPLEWSVESKGIYNLILAEIKLKDAQYEELTDVFLKEAQSQKSEVLYSKAYNSAIRQGEYKKAIIAVEGWQKLVKGDLTNLLVYSYVLDGRIDEAFRIAKKKIIKNKVNSKVVFNLVETLKISWYEKNVLSFYKKLYEAYPDNLSLTFTYLQSLQNNMQVKEALKIVNKTLFKHPRNLNLYTYKSNLYKYDLQIEEAKKVWVSLLNDYPNEDSYHLSYANFLAQTYEYSKAIKQLSNVKSKKLKKIKESILMDIYLKTNNVEKAESLANFNDIPEKELQKEYLSLGILLFNKKFYDRAKYYLEKADSLSKDKKNFQIMLTLAGISYRKDIKEGNKYFKLIEKEFNLEGEDSLVEKVSLLQKIGLKQEALNLLNEAIKKEPKNKTVLYMRSLLAETMGNASLALSDLEKVISIDPLNSDAQNALGYTLLVHSDNLKRAMKLIKKSVFVQPKSPAVIDSLGWAYYKKAEFVKALPFLRYSYQNYNDGEVIGHYIMALYYAGQIKKAKKLYKL